MVKIHKESDFKLQIYFPNLGENKLKPFTFKYYTNKRQYWTVAFDGTTYTNCTACPGGVIAHFTYTPVDQTLKPNTTRFKPGALMVDMVFEVPDGASTMKITDTQSAGIEVVHQEANYTYRHSDRPITTPVYNTLPCSRHCFSARRQRRSWTGI